MPPPDADVGGGPIAILTGVTPSGQFVALRYCLDCVRPHEYIYCDGSYEFRVHARKTHLEECASIPFDRHLLLIIITCHPLPVRPLFFDSATLVEDLYHGRHYRPDQNLAVNQHDKIREYLRFQFLYHTLLSTRPMTTPIKLHADCMYAVTPKFVIYRGGGNGGLSKSIYFKRCYGEYRNIEREKLTMHHDHDEEVEQEERPNKRRKLA